MESERVENHELKAKKIANGTVIDHITAGMSPQILKMLGFERPDSSLVIAINVESGNMGRKDIIKVENKELNEEKINRIAILAPEATINIVKGYSVVRKTKVHLPDVIRNVARCPNRNCVSNAEATPTFHVETRGPVTYRCHYCERLLGIEELVIV